MIDCIEGLPKTRKPLQNPVSQSAQQKFTYLRFPCPDRGGERVRVRGVHRPLMSLDRKSDALSPARLRLTPCAETATPSPRPSPPYRGYGIHGFRLWVARTYP